MSQDQTGQPPPGTPPAKTEGGPPAAPPPLPESAPPELPLAATVPPWENHWAMAAHLAALIGLTGLLGPVTAALHVPSSSAIGPLVVWLIKRRESRFVSFHALQCLSLQLAALAIMLGLVALKLWDLANLVNVAAIAYAVYAGIELGTRHDFSYKFVGPWVQRMMGAGPRPAA